MSFAMGEKDKKQAQCTPKWLTCDPASQRYPLAYAPLYFKYKKCNLFTHEAPKSARNSFKGIRAFQVELKIWKCWFLWREDNQTTRRKTLGAGTRTNNNLNPHMTQSPGFEPRPHWWEAGALTTVPFLLPSSPAPFLLP